jgi:hypothetical protein
MPDPIDEAKNNTRPTDVPTPGQAANSIFRLLIIAITALTIFIIAAATFVTSRFKQ